MYIPPSYLTLTYSEAQIKARCQELGGEISQWANETPQNDILAVPVLRGAIFFFADLVRSLSVSVEVAPLQTWGYLGESNTMNAEGMKVSERNFSVKGRRVLLFDDICDSGRTFVELENLFIAEGALEVKTVALINRLAKEKAYSPAWAAFFYEGPEWFVGYGMDDKERFRNLPSVYRMAPASLMARASLEQEG